MSKLRLLFTCSMDPMRPPFIDAEYAGDDTEPTKLVTGSSGYSSVDHTIGHFTVQMMPPVEELPGHSSMLAVPARQDVKK